MRGLENRWLFAVAIAAQFAFVAVASISLPAKAEDIRFVPQLGLTDLRPVKIAFAPDEESILMVVNEHGRIDIFDISSLDRPLKTAEIEAAAADAAFSPDGRRIVSAGSDGTVRLWTLDGIPAAEPFEGHEGPIWSVAFSPDGTRIASGGSDGTVRLWNPDGTPAAEPIEVQYHWIQSVAFSPDGTRIVSGTSGGSVQLWTLDGEPAGPVAKHGDAVRSVAFSPDGTRIVSGGSDGTVRFWTLSGESAAGPFEGHGDTVVNVSYSLGGPLVSGRGRVLSVAYSPDGTQIASGGDDGRVRLWTPDGEAAAEPFEGHEGWVLSVAFSPDGSRIASGGSEGTVWLWTPGGESAAAPFAGHEEGIRSVAFSPDGTRIASGGDDGTVRIWTPGGEPAVAPFEGRRRRVWSVAFSPDGTRIAAGYADGRVRQWTLEGEPAAASFAAHRRDVRSVAYSPDGARIVTGGDDGLVRLWTRDGAPAAAPFQGHKSGLSGEVLSVAFSADGTRIASGGDDGTVRLWTLDGVPAATPFEGHGRVVRSVAFSPDGRNVVSGGDDGTVRPWSFAGEPAASPLVGRRSGVSSMTFSADGTRIVTGGSGRTVRIWAFDGTPVATAIERHGDGVLGVASSPDGQWIASVGRDAAVRLWTMAGESAAEPFMGHESWVQSVAFSRDGTRIVSGGSDGTVRLWTLDGVPAAGPFEGHVGAVTSVAISPDGSRIASGGTDRTVWLWTASGEPVGERFRAHHDTVRSIVFSPDGTRIISGGDDGTVRLSTPSGESATPPFEGHWDAVLSVALTPDGTRIVSGGSDGTVRLWTFDGQMASIIHRCRTDNGIAAVGGRLLSIGCSDRIVILDRSLEMRGQIYLHPDGIVALTEAGAFAPTEELHNMVRAFGEDGTLLTRRGAVPDLVADQVRQLLFDQWTLWERASNGAAAAFRVAERYYDDLGWMKAPFWPTLGWAIAVLGAVGLWVFAPGRLAHWAMPVAGSPPPPPWKWLIGVLTLYGYLGRTRRPLKAWLRSNCNGLYAECFSGREPVRERERYCDLGHEADISAFAVADRRRGALVWIDGVGGAGKSALAFRMLRFATESNGRAPLPVLVDEDWTGSLAEQVARLMKPPAGDRGPTAEMVVTLGAAGMICPVVDSISERGMDDAAEQVADAAARGAFRFAVVTSRTPPPGGSIWERFERLRATPLTVDQVPNYVATYAPEDRCAEIGERIAPLVEQRESLSPLFLRFTIAQALNGELTQSGTLDLVLRYLEALRAGKVDLSADDMVRAASIAGVEAVRRRLVPCEIDHEFLRGVLVTEADEMAFMDAGHGGSVDPAAVIDSQVSCGLLNRNRTNRRLQFAYDPVAEYLAAYRMSRSTRKDSLHELRVRATATSDSALAKAVQEVERTQETEAAD